MGECCEANNRPSLNAVHRYYRDCLGQGFSGSVKTCDLHCVPDQLFPINRTVSRNLKTGLSRAHVNRLRVI